MSVSRGSFVAVSSVVVVGYTYVGGFVGKSQAACGHTVVVELKVGD